jgi:predicted lipoprotein with Yx(FWY)xxD motif
MTRTSIFAITAIALLGIAGCGDGEDDPAGEASVATETQVASDTPPEPPPSSGGTAIKGSGSQYGTVLFDGDNRAVYYFDKESSSKSECYGACAEAWPPVLTEGTPRGGTGAKADKLGTTERDDGTTQVTYDGHPLYYYDEPPGQVTCHNVEEFGGLWLAVQPNGEPVPS